MPLSLTVCPELEYPPTCPLWCGREHAGRDKSESRSGSLYGKVDSSKGATGGDCDRGGEVAVATVVNFGNDVKGLRLAQPRPSAVTCHHVHQDSATNRQTFRSALYVYFIKRCWAILGWVVYISE